MPDNGTGLPQSLPAPILDDAEVARRMLALGELQAALSALGVRCVLARNHRLVLRYNRARSAPSGLTDPKLHILAPEGTRIATTDATAYRLDNGQEYSASDPAAAAAALSRRPH